MPVHDVVHTCQVSDRYLFVQARCGVTLDMPGRPERPATIGEGRSCEDCVCSLVAIRRDAFDRLRHVMRATSEESS